MQGIMPCLWFDTQAEDAAKFYVSVFKNAKITAVSHYGETGPGPKGSAMTVMFELDGKQYMGLNGGPHFKFTPAVSLVVNCDSQDEIDYYWDKLSADGGQTVECGWLTDKFGLSWQIVPANMRDLVAGDPARAGRVMQEVMKMKKLDIATLQRAYDGR
ncbi:MAG TPA: VOC family protein [Gemmatimonadaceae bacterium]|jgi:predicted 3-demethylubiquinone-9 3-methyltransferase (glyoxalase superfamily)